MSSSIKYTGQTVLGKWDLDSFGMVDIHIPRERVLELRRTSATSAGVFKKFNVEHRKQGLLFVKSGSTRGSLYRSLHPITEKICSEIGLLIGFSVVESKLWVIDRRLFNRIEDLSETSLEEMRSLTLPPNLESYTFDRTLASHNRALVSVTKSFIPDGYKYDSCERVFGEVYHRQLYEVISQSKFFKPDIRKSLHQMILFDFLIHNQDRHTRNFGFLTDGVHTRMTPLFDHGLALLSEYALEEIEEHEGEIWSLGGGKPFGSLLSALDLVDRSSLEDLDLSIAASEIVSIVDKYGALLPPLRLKYMKETVERRWNYVKKVFSPI